LRRRQPDARRQMCCTSVTCRPISSGMEPGCSAPPMAAITKRAAKFNVFQGALEARAAKSSHQIGACSIREGGSRRSLGSALNHVGGEIAQNIGAFAKVAKGVQGIFMELLCFLNRPIQPQQTDVSGLIAFTISALA